MKEYSKTYEWLEARLEKLSKWPDLQKMYRNTFLSTLETTTKILNDGTSYVFTGDIPAMWLRDSSAQVRHYIGLCKIDPDMDRLVSGLIERQFKYILIDPYANAFNEAPDETIGHVGDLPKKDPWVWERKFELDSLCYPLWILDLYYKETNNKTIFTKTVLEGMDVILDTFKTEMNHQEKSSYWFVRPGAKVEESPLNGGHGLAVNESLDLVWSAFRPSDDVCTYNYFIPGNQFVVLALKIIGTYHPNEQVRTETILLAKKIDEAIHTHGVVEHDTFGKIFAYEIDGFGQYHLMDDANVPSLLSLPYLDYKTLDDPLYQNTRKFILSKHNPFYYEGKFGRGVGSPHTPDRYIWHISLVIQALTTTDLDEKKYMLRMLLSTHADTFLMHEGFHVDNPSEFTREWFSWANSLFAYFVDEHIDQIDSLMTP